MTILCGDKFIPSTPLGHFFFDDICSAPFWRGVLCEFVGTTILVIIGCGSIILQVEGSNSIASSSDIVRTSIAFGFAVNFLIKTFGPMSGCHINPAVSIAFMIIGKVSPIRAAFYSIAQLTGGVVGAGLLYSVTPSSTTELGATMLRSGMSTAQGFGAEAIFTFILLLAISACLDDTQADYGKMKITNPMTIGFTVTAIHLVGIPFTGSSLNPARSFGPALITLNWTNHWIYWLGPLCGGCAATVVYHFILSPQFHYSSMLPSSANIEKRPSRDSQTLVLGTTERKDNDTEIVLTAPIGDGSTLHAVLVNSSSTRSNAPIEVPIESYNNQRWNRRRSTMRLPPPTNGLTIVGSVQENDEVVLTPPTSNERRNTIHHVD